MTDQSTNKDPSLLRSALVAAGVLALFGMIGVGLVASIASGTAKRIAENERLATLRNLHELIDEDTYDNDIFTDVTNVADLQLLGSRDPLPVYRARREGGPVALVMTAIAPDGYNGRIKLLIGIDYSGTVRGVRVLDHHETPGLGDGIELEKSNWILGFVDKSLTSPVKAKWAVRKDGGIFDQFTGATITPRAVVKAVRHALEYYELRRDQLFTVNPEIAK
ncbi:MAG: electron transport complex subunit RsxG [Gammaproteobacteria bacterium]|nr:electron transport complex subunit RsxG [Gammaproteobacteria bacterium]MCP5137214.1 electron transport complex subunit RsxG [Gammaproteobacteria bacterium]